MNVSHVYDLIDQISFLLRAEQRKKGVVLGLQPVHYQILSYLSRCNRYSNTPVAVTRYLGITKGTVSQSLLLLENKALIEKSADVNDRRVIHLLLTDAGLQSLSCSERVDIWQQACDDFDDDSLHQIAVNLQSLLRGLQRVNQLRTFGLCKTCKHLKQHDGELQCGLTDESLSVDDTELICHEHAFPDV